MNTTPNSIAARGVLASLTLAPLAVAQQGAAEGPDPTALFANTVVPLHTQADDPIGGSYGTWAAGPNWKASFDDSFTFYPYRGPDAELVRFVWTTESVACGDAELAADRAPQAVVAGPHRYELRYGAVTEAYDVRVDGVEQTFVLHALPANASGDVVVHGRVGGDLNLTPAAEAVQALTLTDGAGHGAVRYGRALAFDATGRQYTVTTQSDGDRISLRLAGSSLADAVFPVTIDPLTSASTVAISTSPVVASAVASSTRTTDQVFVAFSRRFSDGDSDSYGWVTNSSFQNPVLVYTDVSSSWDIPALDVAYVSQPNRYAVAVQREFGTSSAIRTYVHNAASTTQNSGQTHFLATPANYEHLEPKIGGSRGTGNKACLVFEEEPLSPTSSITRARGVRLDVVNGNYGSTFDLHGSSQLFNDTSDPSIVPLTEDQRMWLAVWANRGTLSGTNSIRMARIGYSSNPTSYETIASSTESYSAPRVAASWGDLLELRGLVAWKSSPAVGGGISVGQAIRVRRFDITFGGAAQQRPSRTVASRSAGFLAMGDLACDNVTKSHWAVTYSSSLLLNATTSYLARLGNNGGIVESHTLGTNTDHPVVCAQTRFGTPCFPVTYVSRTGFRPVLGARLDYPTDAIVTDYGFSCSNTTIRALDRPYAGHEDFTIEVVNAGLGPVAFLVGGAPADLDLTAFGLPGCRLLVATNPAPIVVNTTSAGSAFLNVDLPDAPLFTGDVFVQGVILTGAPQTTAGLRVQVR